MYVARAVACDSEAWPTTFCITIINSELHVFDYQDSWFYCY